MHFNVKAFLVAFVVGVVCLFGAKEALSQEPGTCQQVGNQLEWEQCYEEGNICTHRDRLPSPATLASQRNLLFVSKHDNAHDGTGKPIILFIFADKVKPEERTHIEAWFLYDNTGYVCHNWTAKKKGAAL